MSLGASLNETEKTNEFDIFQRTSEIDFLNLADEEDDKAPSVSFRDNPKYRVLRNSLLCNGCDYKPEPEDDIRNQSELAEACQSTETENQDFSDIDSEAAPLNYRDLVDVGNLLEILELEGNEAQHREEIHDLSCGEGSSDSNSLLGASDVEDEAPSVSESDSDDDDEEEAEPPSRPISAKSMSKEARSAILETLNDMNRATTKKGHTDVRLKGVTVQKKIKENRNKYDSYKSLVESRNTFNSKGRQPSSKYKSLDSEGGTTGFDDYSSNFSSESNDKDCDDLSSDDIPRRPIQRLPTIGRNLSQVKSGSTARRIGSLGNVKTKKCRLPGIGKYNVIMDSEEDRDFEITPPGFDSRYDHQPIVTKAERDPPPQHIQQRSILKCRKWLKNVHMSPLSLDPVSK